MASESGNQPNLEQLLQLGIQAAKQGNKENARVLFRRVLDADKDNERAWLFMAAVAETPEDRVRYLNTVLTLNPNNSSAQKQLNQMKKQRESSNTQALRYGAVGLAIITLLIVVVAVVILVF